MPSTSLQIVGIPALSRLVGQSKLKLDTPGNTVTGVVEELVRKYGHKVGEALFDSNGELDLTIQFLLNGEIWVNRDQLGKITIKDSDSIILMGVMAGG